MKNILFSTVLCTTLFYSNLLFSQSQGPNNPSSAMSLPAPNGAPWNTPMNVFASDGSTASSILAAFPSCAGNSCYYTVGLTATGFGFSIPLTATITGIVAEVQRRNINNPVIVKDSTVKLLKAGFPVTTNHAGSAQWTLSLIYASYGSASDLWGATWTPTDINNANFGVYFTVRDTGSGSPGAPQVDHIRLTVYYSVSIGIQNKLTEAKVNVFPNPNNGMFSVRSDVEISDLKIFNLLGEKIYSSEIKFTQSEIDLGKQEKGLYFIQIKTQRGTIVKKLIIE